MSSGIYLDENRCHRRLTQQLPGAGLLVVRVADVGMEGSDDAAQLEFAAANELTIYTENASDFIPLHWKVDERHHSGVIILSPEFGAR
jgi:predicted nuclease of predicted toxin-antitoxin system